MFNAFFRCGTLVGLLCLLAELAYCQHPAALPPLALRYVQVEQMPRLATGKGDAVSIEAALRTRLHYQPPAGQRPFTAADFALLSFTIGADGRVREARVLSKLEPGFGRAVLAAATQLPRFLPGRQEGQPVAVCYTLTIGAAGPYGGNSSSDRGPVALPPTWPEVERYPAAPPRLPGNVGLRTALTQRLVYPPAGSKSRSGGTPSVQLAFTVDAQGQATDALVLHGEGLAYDRAAVAALAALPRFEPYRGLHGPTAVRLEVDVDFPPRPAGYQPVVSSQLPPDPPVDSPAIVDVQSVQVWPGTNVGGRPYLNEVVQQLAVMPPEVQTGPVDGLVRVQTVVGMSGRLYGLRIQKSLTPACDSAALAAVRRLPLLTPAQYQGQTVAVRVTFVVRFWGPNHLYEPGTVPHPATFADPLGLEAYLRANLRVPDSLRTAARPRTVEVLAVVGADGQVKEAAVTQASYPLLDQEALRLVRGMAAWQPARDRQNQPVTSQVPLTLSFPPPLPPSPTPPPPAPAPPTPPVVAPEPIYTYVEQMPALPGGGGQAAITAALQQRFRYPAGALRDHTQGTIRVTFVVGIDGRAGAGRVAQGLSAATDQAALMAVRALPRFAPGRQSGRVVQVSFTLPIAVVPPASPKP